MILEPDEYYYEDGVYRWSLEKRAAAWEDCHRRLAAKLTEGGIRKVVILIGLPGAGKSTWAEANNADDIVIFDGMFVDKPRRTRVLAECATVNIPVEAIWFDVPWQVCYQRNASRSADRRIPDESLQRMQQQLDSDPPSAAEGFVAVHLSPCPPGLRKIPG